MLMPVDAFQARLQEALPERYVLKHEIGRGGMAVVFLAWDRKHECDVALKVLRPELSATLGPSRFLQEIKTAARLKHPYILKLHDSGEAGGFLYYVMPWLEGDTLRKRLVQKGPLPLPDALRVAREVAEALDYAHQNGVVHRDIKPENILFEAGHAVVSDFGIALAVSEAIPRSTGSGTVLGTLEYMSPEQAAGKIELDRRTDIYSLGIVLHEILIGNVPGVDFEGITKTFERQRPDVPASVIEILRRALAPNREDRFANGQQLADALSRVGGASKWLSVAVATVLIAVGAMAVWGVGAKDIDDTTLDPTHIAVLYFDDLSAGGKLAHVAAGLTQDLIEALARVPTLRVISAEGVKSYRGRPLALDSIAQQLQVGTIVTGSVTESRRRLRVEVRLIDPTSGTQLASETFERSQGELFALQDTLTAEVSDALRLRLGRTIEIERAKAGTHNAQAWVTLQRASELRDEAPLVVSDDPSAAAALYLRADSLARIAGRADRQWIEPVLLQGWLAYDISGLPMLGNPTTGLAAGASTVDWLNRAMAHADHALAMQAADPRALTLRGTVKFREWFVAGGLDSTTSAMRLADAERDLRGATDVPHRDQARAWGTLSQLLQLQGRVEQAYFAAQRAYATDAYLFNGADIVYRLFHTSFQLARDSEAVAWCDTGRQRFPMYWLFLHCRLTLLGFAPGLRPTVDEAWKLVAAARVVAPVQHRIWLEPRLRMMAATVIARAGHVDSAERVIRAARGAASTDPELLYLEALARIQLRDPDSAVSLLAENLRGSPDARAFLRSDRQLRSLLAKPRFKRLVGGPGP